VAFLQLVCGARPVPSCGSFPDEEVVAVTVVLYIALAVMTACAWAVYVSGPSDP
jgi:hypothetical protein